MLHGTRKNLRLSRTFFLTEEGLHDEIGNVTERHITEEAAKQFEGLNGIPSQLVEKQFLQTFLADLIDHFPRKARGINLGAFEVLVPILGVTHQTTFDVFLPQRRAPVDTETIEAERIQRKP